jgi:hypothetical protein
LDLYLEEAYSDSIDRRKHIEKENAMNTTTFDTAARDTAANRGWLKALGARLRHALETLGRPYVNGQFPSY